SALQAPLHAHVLVVAEPREALLRAAHREGPEARIAHQYPRAAPRDPRLRRGPQRALEALRVVEVGRCDPRVGAPLRPADDGRPQLNKYGRNQVYRGLGRRAEGDVLSVGQIVAVDEAPEQD